MANDKFVTLTPEIMGYLLAHSSPTDAVIDDLVERTAEFGAVSGMQVAPEVGPFLGLITRLIGATHAVEIGTFTGLSALWIARSLAPGGHLHCFDISEEWTAVAQDAWASAGVQDRITLRIGPALERLDELPDIPIDVAFIDADKPNYANYVDALIPRLAPRGVIAVDNVLWSGTLIDPNNTETNTEALRAFNTGLLDRGDVIVTMLSIGDGLTLVTRA